MIRIVFCWEAYSSRREGTMVIKLQSPPPTILIKIPKYFWQKNIGEWLIYHLLWYPCLPAWYYNKLKLRSRTTGAYGNIPAPRMGALRPLSGKHSAPQICPTRPFNVNSQPSTWISPPPPLTSTLFQLLNDYLELSYNEIVKSQPHNHTPPPPPPPPPQKNIFFFFLVF